MRYDTYFRKVRNPMAASLRAKDVKSAHWRIVIPNLTQYAQASPKELRALKQLILQRLHRRPQHITSSIKSQFQRGLRYYRIALQRHQNNIPHLDILLSYDKSIRRQVTDYDYLLKHGDITTYRKLNSAIIDYGKKQDKQNLSNFPEDTSEILEIQQLKADPYLYLYRLMCKDPLHFNLEQYVKKYQLSQHIKGWSSIKVKLKDMQVAAANLSLKQKPGFQLITPGLIEQQLDSAELAVYYSWKGYQTIVNYLNQIITLGYKRPLKTKNLLITGPASIGKTSLFEADLANSRNCIQRYCAVYPMGTKTWWPDYKPQVYKLIFWNQAKLTSYSYDTVLKVLQGSKVDLPYKGGSTLKYDNPLIIMTSNMTLNQMIKQKFGHNQQYIKMAKANLAVRIENVIVPEGLDLFLLQKLLIPKGTD